MPLPAVFVTLTAAERKALKKRIRGARTAWRDRLRAQIVLAAAMGRSTARIARDLRIGQDTARKWRPVRGARPGKDSLICRGLGGRGRSARRYGRRWWHWPASCRPLPGYRWRTGPARSWLPN